MSALLELRDVTAGYGGVQVLWGLSLAVAPGELCCVLGPNGAGKTTMAKVLTGALPCMSGSIHLDGEPITRRTPEGRATAGVAHVPQGRRVFPELTVRENLQVARFAARGRASAETETFVHELFPRLRDLATHQAGTLSGGEQQMLAVGRALMTEPRLLVLDEPSLGLAPVLVADLYTAIARIRDRGVAILLVEQAVEAALGVAHTVAMLESGRITMSGPVDEFRDVDVIGRAYLGGGLSADGEAS